MSASDLYLYEEVMLLALRDDKGTVAGTFPEYAISGAILAELLLDRRISVDDSRRKLVNILERGRIGDPVIDECIERMIRAKRRASLATWVSRLAAIKKLRHKVARRLCHRGILRADEDKVLLLFTRKIYPEINPEPEREIVERLRTAIFEEDEEIDPRTLVLLSLASATDLLKETFGRKEVRARKKRIKQLSEGNIVGGVTREVIEACQAALVIAVVIPSVIATSTATT